MNNYILDKGETLDINGRILNNFIHTNLKNASYIKIDDTSGGAPQYLGTINNISNLFTNLNNVINIDISNMNLQNVISADQLFYQCHNLTNIKLSDMNNLRTGYRMFEKCNNLQNIQLGNIVNCTNFRAMFSTCENLTEYPIRPQDFKNDCIYRYTYANANNLLKYDIYDMNLNNCDLSNTFQYCNSDINIYNLTFTNCSNLSGFCFKDNSSVTNFTKMNNCTFINIPNCYRAFTGHREIQSLENIYVENCNANQLFSVFSNMEIVKNIIFKNCSSTDFVFGWCYTDLKFENIQFLNCNNVKSLFANDKNLLNINNIVFENCRNFSYMFENCYNLSDVSILNMNNCIAASRMFYACSNLSPRAYENIANMLPNANQLTNMFLSNIGLNINNFSSAAYNILHDKGYLEAGYLDLLSNYYNIYIVDNGSWKNISKTSNYDIQGNILRSTVRSLEASNIIIQDEKDHSLLENLSNLFYNSSNLRGIQTIKTINLSGLNTSKVKDMSRAFEKCYNLINVSNFDTSNVSNFNWTFFDCFNLIALPNINTINATSFERTFFGCKKLVTIPNYDLSNAVNMLGTFEDCFNLQSIPNFNTINVEYMACMFQNCGNIKNLPEYDTSNCYTFHLFAANCFNLVNVPEYSMNNMASQYFNSENCVRQMFAKCNNLSNNSIQNIINMILNINGKYLSMVKKNLNVSNEYSPFYASNITNTRYSNRLTELTAAGWSY